MEQNKELSFSEIFGDAIWIQAGDGSGFPVFRKTFEIDTAKENIKEATIDIVGFGAFVFYVNGVLGTEDLFLPLNSDFEERNFPEGEETAHRVYVSHYNITPILKSGRNTLAVLLGDGWYNGNYSDVPFGGRKLCYRISVRTASGEMQIVSDEKDLWHPSFVTDCVFNRGEAQDFSGWEDSFLEADFDDSGWEHAISAKALDTRYFYSDCPTDRVISEIVPKVVAEHGDVVVYDAGKNLSGYPLIEARGDVSIEFSEALSGEDLDEAHMHSQYFAVKAGEKPQLTHPQFTWMGFRYFRVRGDARVICVQETHSNVDIASDFCCSDETLNWIYKAFLNTQLSNMHGGITSDCPHIERRGYTGDGQLTCRAVMRCLDAKDFYNKWIDDISDCQDRKTGHVQYTAPYTHSGGGPGGWGAAIVLVPYEYWKYYGDDSKIRSMYPRMIRYFDYLDAHSEMNLVTSDRKNEWCLGEWCTPGSVALPAPFVNNYFYVKALEKVIEIATYLGKTEDVSSLQERMAIRKKAIVAAYFNPHGWNRSFMGNIQGANAFGLDIGLGDESTKNAFIADYEKNAYYDTGIFGTDIVTRKLFDYGRGDIVYRMMTAKEPHSFGTWKENGATSFWEYWDNARSHSHPMFGAVVAYFFEYMLGIRYEVASDGTPQVRIAPVDIPQLTWIKGHITTPFGKIFVSRVCENGVWKTETNIPEGIKVIE